MIEVGVRSSRSCERGGGGRQRAQSRSPHRRGRTRTSAMAYRTLLALAALVAFVATAHSETAQPRLIDFDPWSWLPTTRNRSPSIMDYFFPPSRTPKQSNLEPPHDREPPHTTASRPTTGDETSAHTTVEARTVNPTRKATATPIKNKSTSSTRSSDNTATAAATGTLKTKKPAQRISASPETTANFEITKAMKIETSTDSTTISVLTASEPSTLTPRPTKHYTIHPVRAAERTTSTDAETTYDTKGTEVIDDTAEEGVTGTTSAEFKETSPTLNTATAAESRATSDDAGTGATTQPADASTEPADGREGYLPLRDRPAQTHVKINEQTKKETVPLPAGSTSVLAKPTKYHYYPHNQHIYLLPECAIQQVCNAVYVRLNYTQPLCACPSRYRDPCSASLNADDLHTTRLTTDSKKRYAHKAVTLVKTCEAVSEMRECRAPRDWSLLALQNIRTGKSHYLVICRCSENHILEGPMSHDQPTYASVPGIRVYGMMCVRPAPYPTSGYNANRYTAVTIQSTTSPYKIDYSQPHFNPEKPIYSRFPSHNYAGSSFYNRMSRVARVRRSAYRSSKDNPPFPWYKVREFARTLQWID